MSVFCLGPHGEHLKQWLFVGAEIRGDFLVEPLYYKIFVGEFLCPTDLGQKQTDSDNVYCRMLESNQNSDNVRRGGMKNN